VRPVVGALAAHDLVFETWAMFDQAFDDRLGDVEWKELRELAAEPPALESVQPALAAYVAEQLDNLEDEEPAFGAAERAQVERVIATACAALARVVADDGSP
jgi:phospholipase/lecithinase/hemolysin